MAPHNPRSHAPWAVERLRRRQRRAALVTFPASPLHHVRATTWATPLLQRRPLHRRHTCSQRTPGAVRVAALDGRSSRPARTMARQTRCEADPRSCDGHPESLIPGGFRGRDSTSISHTQPHAVGAASRQWCCDTHPLEDMGYWLPAYAKRASAALALGRWTLPGWCEGRNTGRTWAHACATVDEAAGEARDAVDDAGTPPRGPPPSPPPPRKSRGHRRVWGRASPPRASARG